MTPHADDATDILAALTHAVERAEVWLVDGADGTLDDKLRLHAYLATLGWAGGRLTAIATAVETDVAASLDEPRELDGQLWAPKVEKKHRGFDRAGLRSAVNRWAFRHRPDPETGEVRDPTAREAADDIWTVADVATGRTAKLWTGPGIALDEYAQYEERLRVKAIDPASIHPAD